MSSLSPPHFDKSEKTLQEHTTKSEKSAQPEGVAGTEKTKRPKRKDKADKDKADKGKSRKSKGQSPSNPLPETDPEAGFDGVSGKGRGSDQDAPERQKSKGESDSLSANQLTAAHQDSVKSERSEMNKCDNAELDGKARPKKHSKSDIGSDEKDSSVDLERLAARKRRFADTGGKTAPVKKSRNEEEEDQSSELGASFTYLKEQDVDKQKDSQRRDARLKTDKGSNQKDGQEDIKVQREKPEGFLESLESKRHPGSTSSRRASQEGNSDQSSVREQDHAAIKPNQNAETNKIAKNKDDHVDIDLSQSYRKQMEQNRRLNLQKQQRESDKNEKTESTQRNEAEDLEHRSLVHEVGKPPEDVTDTFPSHKPKKSDQFDTESGIKRERVYRRQSKDPEWTSVPSPAHQLFSQHVDEEYIDPSHKELGRNDEKVHPELELFVKRTHSTQVNKAITPVNSVEEEQHKRWESRSKQDLLPNMSFSRGLSKNIPNRKHLEYGIWHDLEPGEVRSDSEEDREVKSHSPMPSTSIPLSERPRPDRFSDPKLAHLERNKFYSIAFDQNITPDTKALLERAKSLSSSREDNWSFLDYDPHFANFCNRKDTEKVESTPRPTPSWYKKKIRSGSEDKLDDRKEEPKPEEHERRELFASRFLHSAVFELDSRRLQLLERKHKELEHMLNQQASQQGTDSELETGPVVLFHSRYLEFTQLQQQKNKTQQVQEDKGDTTNTDEKKEEKTPDPEQQTMQSPSTAESVTETEIKPIIPAEEVIPEQRPLPVTVPTYVNKDMAPSDEKSVTQNAAPEVCPAVALIKDEIKEKIKQSEVEPINRSPTEMLVKSEPASTRVSEPNYSFNRPKLSPTLEKLDTHEDVKPPVEEETCNHEPNEELVCKSEPELDPEATQPEPEVPVASSPVQLSFVEEMDVTKKETYPSCEIPVKPEEEKNVQVNTDHIPVTNDTNEEIISSQKENKAKEIKSKKSKQSPAHVAQVPVTPATVSEKQATRKSERIDKEKLKRGSSPRAEPKFTSKSPIHGSDHDIFETSIPLGRARRRNVKSVYATPVEDDTSTLSRKDIMESPRSGRKRVTEKDTVQQSTEQEPPAPAPTAKRGRPPKNRKLGEESSAAKAEKIKLENKDTDSNESESGERIQKVPKGKTIPQVTKSSLNPLISASGSASTRKADKTETANETREIPFTDPHSLLDSSSLSKDSSVKNDNSKKDEKLKHGIELCKDVLHEKVGEETSNGKDTNCLVDEKSTSDKEFMSRERIKPSRTPKSPVLKNLKIRLNVTEVKDLLQLGDEELGNQEDASKKIKPGDLNDAVSKNINANKGCPDEEKDSKEIETAKSLISQEQELEQAVENIAKLTDPTFSAEPPTPPVLPADTKSDTEEEKPSNPASETELMAAIDSITAEEASVSLPQAPPIQTDVCPEPEVQDLIQPVKVKGETNTCAKQEEPVFPNTPKKGNKGRPRTPKRSKAAKQVKKDPKEEQPLTEEQTMPLPSDAKIVSETPPTAAAAAVITSTTWKPEPELPAATESVPTLEELKQPLKSLYPQAKSPIFPKSQQLPPDSNSPALASNKSNLRPIQTNRAPLSPPDWRQQAKDTGVSSPHVMSMPNKESQPTSSDSEKMSIDHSTRQIVMKTKPSSLQSNLSIASNLPNLRDQNLSDSSTPLTAVVPNKSPHPDSRIPTHSAPPVVRPPVSLTSSETKSVISVIASTGTSVISRVCNPSEPEEKVNLNIGNPCLDMALPKTAYRPSKDETGSYHGPSDEGASAPRFIVESPALGTGSCPGLRVNTSEGVVVLSHSGQKTEGPQRISAKISQIPQATAGDMESQQLVSMPQIKQDMYGHSQSGHQKGPSSQTDYGHSGKPQSALSIKHESSSLEKMESAYQSQGVVKRLTQGNQQVINYHQDYMPLKHPKKNDSVDSLSTDGVKSSWTSTISPAISPHLPSPPGNHVGFVSSAGDRTASHLGTIKPEPRSPRKSGHPHSPFTKVSSPIGSSSPKGIPVMLSSGHPAMQQYITSVHHPEQSVIMPPHSVPGGLGRMSPHCVSQSIPVGHLVQGDVRVNTPPLSVMNYGIHGESLAWSGPLQPRSSPPQPAGRDKVLKVNPGSLRSHEGEQDDSRHLNQTGRPPASMPSDPRGPLRSSVSMETYMVQRDMRVLVHHQGERLNPDPHPGHIQETLNPSLSPRAHILPKGVSEKDIAKSLDAKRPHSPLPKDGMMGVRQAGPAMASPQRVQLMPPGPSGSYPEYSAIYSNRIHSKIPETPVGHNQPPLTVTQSMVSNLQLQVYHKHNLLFFKSPFMTLYLKTLSVLLVESNTHTNTRLHFFFCQNFEQFHSFTCQWL